MLDTCLDVKDSTPRRDGSSSQARHSYDRLDAGLDSRLDRLDARLDTSTPGLRPITHARHSRVLQQGSEQAKLIIYLCV